MMNRPLLDKIRAVRRRLILARALRLGLLATAWLGLALALYVVASRLVPLPAAAAEVAPWLAGAGAAWWLAALVRRRATLLEAALRTDEALGLKERLSTGMLLEQPRGEVEQAVLADAIAHARRVRPGEVIRIELGRQMSAAAGSLALLALIFFFMPQWNLLAGDSRAEVKREVERVTARRESARRLDELAAEIAEQNQLQKPEPIQGAQRELAMLARQLREQQIDAEQALARMDKLNEKLRNQRSEMSKQLERAADMKSRGEGRMTSEIAKDIQNGNFGEAAQALQELKDKLQKGELNEEEKQALAREMKAMADKMSEQSPVAQALGAAAEQMSEGNFNAAMAELEDAAGEMMQLEGMLAQLQMLEQLQSEMEGQRAAMAAVSSGKCSDCGGQLDSGGKCESCGAEHGQPGEGQPGGEGGEGMEGSEGQGEGQGQAQGAGRTSDWQPGEGGQGQGMGGPGQGRGGVARRAEGEVAFERRQIKGDLVAGEIIARFKVEGTQTPGEVTAQYEELRLEFSQRAEDTIQREPLPLEHKALVRDYFDSIKQERKAQPQPAPTPGATP